MLNRDTPMFLLIPNPTNERVLHPGKVIESDNTGFAVEFDAALTVTVGMEVNAYGDVRGKFYQQGASVTEIRIASPKSVIAFARVGEPVSAENRQTYRVSTVLANFTGTIGGEAKCQIVDVSPEGFGAIVAKELRIGSTVAATLTYEDRVIITTARVQTIKALDGGKFRCGFLPTEKKGPIQKSLEQITGMIQRAQLRRLAGAA